MIKDSKTANHGHQGAIGFDDVLTVDKWPQGGRYVDPETVPKGSGEGNPELIDNLTLEQGQAKEPLSVILAQGQSARPHRGAAVASMFRKNK